MHLWQGKRTTVRAAPPEVRETGEPHRAGLPALRGGRQNGTVIDPGFWLSEITWWSVGDYLVVMMKTPSQSSGGGVSTYCWQRRA